MENLETNIKEEIKTGKNIAVNILRLAKSGKRNLRFIIGEILKKHNASHLFDEIFTTVSELTFNAIKANYKHILIKDKLNEYLASSNAAHKLKQVMANKTLYNGYVKNINIDSINKLVRATLTKEEQVNKILEKVKKENRKLFPDEKTTIKENLSMMRRAQSENIKVFLNFNFDKNNVIIDIINDSPITENDLERINEKRTNFSKYLAEGREQDFYIENLDETESAGFGLAMIDSRLFNFGINPLKNFQIFGIGNKTCLTITFPINLNTD